MSTSLEPLHPVIEIRAHLPHELATRLRREACKRDTTVDRLIRDLLDTIVQDKLVQAVLDD